MDKETEMSSSSQDQNNIQFECFEQNTLCGLQISRPEAHVCMCIGSHKQGLWYICSTAIEGGPFSYKLPPELAISRNMAGICIITQQ